MWPTLGAFQPSPPRLGAPPLRAPALPGGWAPPGPAPVFAPRPSLLDWRGGTCFPPGRYLYRPGCAASTEPGAFGPCDCLCLSPVASHQAERGMVRCRYPHRPGGPPPTPTHALGSSSPSRPSGSLNRFAVSACAIRVPPIFWDVLHEHHDPPLHLLDSALCSPARSKLETDLAGLGLRRCADPFVAVDSTGT